MSVESSFITNITFVCASNQLIVSMTSGVYMYESVPAEIVALFLVAESKGAFFNKWIKNEYRAYKLN